MSGIRVPFLDLKGQYESLKGEIAKATDDVLSSGWYILGPEVEAFEKAFAEYNGSGHAVGVGSGTDAIWISLAACGVKPGDKVVTVPNTAVPTICAIVSAGATPVFVDVDPDTANIDPDKLEEVLSKDSKSIKAAVPVHLYGMAAEMDRILDIAARHDLSVIEDVAQAAGAQLNGVKTGAMGAAGCFSFYPTKNLGAYGDGGMIVTNDADVAKQCRRLRNYGEEKKFVNAIHGFNSRLDELQAAMLNVKLERLDEWNERRRALAEIYYDKLRDCPGVSCFEKDGGHVYHLFVIKAENRDGLKNHLAGKGVQTAIHYPSPAHFQPAYKYLGYAQGDFPVAEELAGQILSLPLYPELPEQDVDYICGSIKEFYG